MIILMGGRVPVGIYLKWERFLNYAREEYRGHFFIENRSIPCSIEVYPNTQLKPHISLSALVGYNEEGALWFDRGGNKVQISFNGFKNGPTQLYVDPEFDLSFFGIILEYLISFKSLQYGLNLCHAASFTYKDKVILLPAWRQTGKTNLLLSILKANGQYIADDWSYLSNQGRIVPFPKRMHLLFYNFALNPALLNTLSPEQKELVDFSKKASQGDIDLSDHLAEKLREKIRIRTSIEQLFGEPTLEYERDIDTIILLQKIHQEDVKLEIRESSPEHMATSMHAINTFEQLYFHHAYSAYKVAGYSPDPYLEKRHQLMKDNLRQVTKKVESLFVLRYGAYTTTDLLKEAIEDVLAQRIHCGTSKDHRCYSGKNEFCTASG